MSRHKRRMPPRQMIPARTRRELTLAQHVNVDAIARGDADVTLMQEWAEGVLMFSRMAEKLGLGAPEISEQLHVTRAVVERYNTTRRIAFEGDELQVARQGLVVFELLAEACDLDTGMEAAVWSTLIVQRLGTVPALAAGGRAP